MKDRQTKIDEIKVRNRDIDATLEEVNFLLQQQKANLVVQTSEQKELTVQLTKIKAKLELAKSMNNDSLACLFAFKQSEQTAVQKSDSFTEFQTLDDVKEQASKSASSQHDSTPPSNARF